MSERTVIELEDGDSAFVGKEDGSFEMYISGNYDDDSVIDPVADRGAWVIFMFGMIATDLELQSRVSEVFQEWIDGGASDE